MAAERQLQLDFSGRKNLIDRADFGRQPRKARTSNGMMKAVLAKLNDFARDKPKCWPKQKTLAERIGCSVSAVRRAIDRLEAVQVLHSVRSSPYHKTYQVIWSNLADFDPQQQSAPVDEESAPGREPECAHGANQSAHCAPAKEEGSEKNNQPAGWAAVESLLARKGVGETSEPVRKAQLRGESPQDVRRIIAEFDAMQVEQPPRFEGVGALRSRLVWGVWPKVKQAERERTPETISAERELRRWLAFHSRQAKRDGTYPQLLAEFRRRQESLTRKESSDAR